MGKKAITIASFGFDFEAIYDDVVQYNKVAYTMPDGRKVITHFESLGASTKVVTNWWTTQSLALNDWVVECHPMQEEDLSYHKAISLTKPSQDSKMNLVCNHYP